MMKRLFIILLAILLLSACSTSIPPERNVAEASSSSAPEQATTEPEPVSSATESIPSEPEQETEPASKSLASEEEQEAIPESHPISSEEEQAISPPVDPADPPKIIILRGVDSVVTLHEILSRSDDEIEAYLRETNLYMNGLESKKDIEALFDTLGSLHFPVTTAGQFSGMTVYEGRETVDVFYELPDEVRCVFNVSTEPNAAKRIMEENQSSDIAMEDISGAAQSAGGLLSEAVDFPEGVRVHASANKNEAYDIQYFDMDVAGEYIGASVFGAKDLTAAAKILQAFDFVRLDFSSAAGVGAIG